jgi:peptide/nickel transport system permease protein
MQAYLIRRLLQGAIILIIVSLLVFFVMRLLPGDPMLIYITEQGMHSLTGEQLQNLRHQFGLDRPLMLQYMEWFFGVLRGDFGNSLVFTNERIADMIAKRLPISIHLGIMALILSATIGITAGVLCAVRRGTWLDTSLTLLTNLGVTMPVFWLGMLMIYLFGLRLGWLSIQGYTSPFQNFWLSVRQVIMPVICLSAFSVASIARQTRSSMLEVIRQDYIRTARSKGLTQRLIIMRHALKNGLIPVITLLGMQVRTVFGGAILVETVFNIPGMGRMLVEALLRQDYTVVQGGILVIAVVVVLSNLAVDLSYGWIDPRIRYN